METKPKRPWRVIVERDPFLAGVSWHRIIAADDWTLFRLSDGDLATLIVEAVNGDRVRQLEAALREIDRGFCQHRQTIRQAQRLARAALAPQR